MSPDRHGRNDTSSGFMLHKIPPEAQSAEWCAVSSPPPGKQLGSPALHDRSVALAVGLWEGRITGV
jgi:hypothetical protein